MKKCILLVRVSTQRQDLDSQREKVKSEALKDGYSEESIVVIEDKESGVKLSEEERNGLNRMKYVIETEDVETVYTYEISRISRRSAVVFSIRDYLLSKGVQLIVLNPYFRMLKEDGSISESGNIFFSLFSGLAENEGYLRKERVKRGLEKKRSEGNVFGRKPLYGYRKIDGKPVLNESESEVIKEIYSRFESGEGCGSIGKDLYLRGVFGSELKLNSVKCKVSDILYEERYCGSVFPFPGIVSKKDFERVREIISKKDGKFSRVHYTDKDYYCAGLLYTKSGYAMQASYGNNRYQYRSGEAGSGKDITVNMKIVDRVSLYALKKYLESGVNEKERKEERDDVSKKININKDKLNNIEKKIQLLQAENEMIENRIIKGRLNENKGDKMIDENNLIIKKLEENKDDIVYENGVFTNRLIYLDSFMYESDSPVVVDTVDDIRRNLRKYIDRIIVERLGFGKFRLLYKFKDRLESVYHFYSIVHKVEYYDKDMNIINL